MTRGATTILQFILGPVFVAAICPIAHGQPRLPPGGYNSVRILFIGNSFTYANNLPEMFRGLAQSTSAPPAITVEMVAVGGATLMSTWNEGRARETIKTGLWDYVVLQEQSSLGSLFVNGRVAINAPE